MSELKFKCGECGISLEIGESYMLPEGDYYQEGWGIVASQKRLCKKCYGVYTGENLKGEDSKKSDLKENETIEEKIQDKKNINEKVILEYEKEDWGDTIDCKFTIIVPEIINEQFLKNIEFWVDNKIKTDPMSTKIELEKLTPNKFSLLISGKGKDNRCIWCKSFRTSLKTLCSRKGIGFLQQDFCTFEE